MNWRADPIQRAGRVNCYTYDGAGNLIQTDRPDGTRETDTYDALGQLTERKDIRLSDGAVINEYHYTYDERGNILSVTGTGTAGITVSAQGEVSAGGGTDSSNGNNTGTESGTQTAQEGTTSELSQAEQALLVLQDTSMTYDADNRLIRYNGEDVRYDADGNMVYGPVDGVMTTLVYDCRNRLVKAGEVRYEYDAENVRTAVITQEAGTEYVTDRVSALPQVLETYVTAEESDSETKTKEPVNDSKTDSAKDSEEEQTGNDLEPAAVFVYGNGLLYSYEVSAAEKQGGAAADGEGQENPQSTVQTAYTETKGSLLVYHYNNIGSTTALTDQTGTVVERYVYGAYGEISGGDTARTAYLYNGMYGVQTDANGLYYMRARYYNVDIKRFINRDVVKGNLQNSQSLNRYSYVQGNPVSLIDPFGLSPFKFKINIHSVLDFIGVIPGIGDLADVANAFLYLKEKDYKNAARSGLCALPFMGELAGVTILAKAPKAARCVRNATRIIGYGATFNWAAEGATDSAVNIYHNIVSGNFFSKDTAKNLVIGGMNAAAMIFSGKQVADSTKDLARLAKSETPRTLSKVKESDSAVSKTEKQETVTSTTVKGNGSYGGSATTNKGGNGKVSGNATSKGGSGSGNISTPNSGQGFSPNGYNPQPGERTLDGYVKNHASPEISLHTDSAGFNNNNGNVGGDFKRFGAESHGGVSPHVHQPQRNVAPNGNIYGTVGTKTANGASCIIQV